MQRASLALAPFYPLQAEHPNLVLNNSYTVTLNDDLHPSDVHGRFNFLQAAREEASPTLPFGVSERSRRLLTSNKTPLLTPWIFSALPQGMPLEPGLVARLVLTSRFRTLHVFPT